MTNSLKLRAAILERGFTQEQLAEQLGMTIATVSYTHLTLPTIA